MFAELARVMNYAAGSGTFHDSLSENVVGKRTKSNLDKTNILLQKLYTFNPQYAPFRAFAYFWPLASETDQRIMALLLALTREPLLAESADLVLNTRLGESATVEQFLEGLEHRHPDRYSKGSAHAIAQRLASSWKQAGYLEGKVKTRRVQPQPQLYAVTYALLLAYLHGERGEFILRSKWVQALGLPEAEVRKLAAEAALHNLLQYQAAAAVTVFAFPQLYKLLDLHGLES